jgi:hypothetical protein
VGWLVGLKAVKDYKGITNVFTTDEHWRQFRERGGRFA